MTTKDAAIAARAGRAFVRTELNGGMIAVNQAIAACYARAFHLSTRDAILYCITLDEMAFQTDQSFHRQNNTTPLDFNTRERTTNRIVYAVSRQTFGYQPSDPDLSRKMVNAGMAAGVDEIDKMRHRSDQPIPQQRHGSQNCSLIGCR